MRLIGNILWFVLAGLWLAISYVIAGVFAIVFIVTIPLCVPAFRMAAYVIWPFGRSVVKDPQRGRGVSAVGNIVWIILFGWWLALSHIISGALLCLTIIGIPFGVANFKLVPLAFAPYGKVIVPTDSLRPGMEVDVSMPQTGSASREA